MEIVCRIKTYIQPFERQLALEELRALAGDEPVPVVGTFGTADSFKVKTNNIRKLRDSLVYWEAVGDSPVQLTAQVRAEATLGIARNGVDLAELPTRTSRMVEYHVPPKRCLRYGTHGIHEYRGKFFPQLVRALLNTTEIPSRGLFVDPMCGSGTSVVEAALAGLRAIGVDMNPLSVFVANTKCAALTCDTKKLITGYEDLRKRLSRGAKSKIKYFHTLPDGDQEYLSRWLPAIAIKELDAITLAIANLPEKFARDFFSVSLSNIVRRVSHQKEDDLRVRREENFVQDGFVTESFLDEALRAAKAVVAFISSGALPKKIGSCYVEEGDARAPSEALLKMRGKVDCVITSPPYATALPYLDTDRLSLIYLGLLPRHDHRSRDSAMIGNREVTDKKRRVLWDDYLTRGHELPLPVQELINKIHTLNSKKEVGFRRRNLPSLLAKYFFDMRIVLQSQRDLLKPGGRAFFVVGNNRTVAGDEEVQIDTAEQLARIAATIGFEVAPSREMEMLVSRDIFRNNAMPSERILEFRKIQ